MFVELTNPIGGSAFESPGLASVASYPGLICCVGYNAVGVALFLISSFQKGKRRKESVFHERDEPHRGSAFDSPGLPNDSAGYPGLAYGLWGTTP